MFAFRNYHHHHHDLLCHKAANKIQWNTTKAQVYNIRQTDYINVEIKQIQKSENTAVREIKSIKSMHDVGERIPNVPFDLARKHTRQWLKDTVLGTYCN